MGNLQLEWSRRELLETHPVDEPLIVNGVRCHGGFLADGTYVSPRTRFRAPAIAAWQQHHVETFGTEILHAPIETWPGAYPNLEQSRLLLREGVREPLISTLTRIGTVEGFGAMIRFLAPDDMQPAFADDISGTATAHLGRGLVEAHARDEAGWDAEAGHDRMWFAVRDVAFGDPVTEDQTTLMLERMGLTPGGASPEEARARFADFRQVPEIDVGLEMLIATMCRVLFIEIKAFHVFAWAEELLSDDDLVAGEGEGARLVACIRADETPHVEYLRTSLTEMRDRTFRTSSGGSIAGSEVIRRVWDRSMEESLGVREVQGRDAILGEIRHALATHPRRDDLLEEFHSVGEFVPDGDGGWRDLRAA